MKKIISVVLIIAIVCSTLIADTGSKNRFSITREERAHVSKSVMWTNISWCMAAGTCLSVPIIFTVDPFAGGILTILFTGGWTISQMLAATSLKGLQTSTAKTGSNVPDFNFTMWSHVMSGAFGMGAITAGGLVFTDNTGTAEILTILCLTLSLLIGVVGNIANYIYSASVNSIEKAYSE